MKCFDANPSSTLHTNSSGCWTCKLRRKKCDETSPFCNTCTSLGITCHYDRERPQWMDGGVQQEAVAKAVKRQVKENAHHRGTRRTSRTTSSHPIGNHNTAGSHAKRSTEALHQTHNDWHACTVAQGTVPLEQSDTVLLAFYLESFFPFLYPFYHPSPFEGGKSWILEMMIYRPVVRHALLCQSSYVFSLAQGSGKSDCLWETVLAQTGNALEVLRGALQIIGNSSTADHVPGAVRVLASIVQIQRFEIAFASFDSCEAHLSAALALFNQLLESTGTNRHREYDSKFNDVLAILNLSPLVDSPPKLSVPTAEQASFRFTAALLIYHDIIASTTLQKEPQLHEHHHRLLCSIDGKDPVINLEPAVGCQNSVLIAIGEIAVLDAWKSRCKRAGSLDVIELADRATAIKIGLTAKLAQLGIGSRSVVEDNSSLMDMFTANHRQPFNKLTSSSSACSHVWAHAALLYLNIVVSGWQTANHNVTYHVSQIIALLTGRTSPPEMLRTMVWPFCIAGCLAEAEQEEGLRSMVEALKPRSIFGTVYKALEIMETAWRTRHEDGVASCDLAQCFGRHGQLILLV